MKTYQVNIVDTDTAEKYVKFLDDEDYVYAYKFVDDEYVFLVDSETKTELLVVDKIIIRETEVDIMDTVSEDFAFPQISPTINEIVDTDDPSPKSTMIFVISMIAVVLGGIAYLFV